MVIGGYYITILLGLLMAIGGYFIDGY